MEHWTIHGSNARWRAFSALVGDAGTEAALTGTGKDRTQTVVQEHTAQMTKGAGGIPQKSPRPSSLEVRVPHGGLRPDRSESWGRPEYPW